MKHTQIDYSRKWHVMASVAMGIFLATIDGSIVNVALPTLVRAFATDFPTVQWVILSYLLTLATLMLSVGRLADIRGKKPIYTTGFVIFTVGSALCGLSPSVYWLIGFRVLQAVGATMIFSLGMAIVTEAFPPTERGRALGISGTMISVGIVIGPTLGGFLIDALSWRWIFYVNLPVGILGTLMAIRFLPAIEPPGGQRFDFGGALTLFVSLLSLLLALTLGQQSGFGAQPVLLLFIGWALFLAMFISIEWRIKQPMIDLRLFRNRLFSGSLAAGFLTFVAIAGAIILIPFYLENVLGYGARQVGLLLATAPVGMGIIAPISGALSDRFGTRQITIVGLIVLAFGYYTMSTLSLHTSAVGFGLRFLPIGIGMGVFQSPNNSAIMGTAPRERLGVVSGMLAISRTLGQTTGIAVLGAIWAGRVLYHAGAALPGGATAAPAADQVAALNDTFLGIVFMLMIALGLAIWGLLQERRAGPIPAETQSMGG